MYCLKDLSSSLSDGLEKLVSTSCYHPTDSFLGKNAHSFSKLEGRLQARLDVLRWL